MAENKIPESLERLFWSYDFASLHLEKDKRVIVKQVLSYGNIEDWKWLISKYGKTRVQEIISDFSESEFRPQTLKLIKILLEAKPSYVSRNTR